MTDAAAAPNRTTLPARFIEPTGRVRYGVLQTLYRQRVHAHRGQGPGTAPRTAIPAWLYADPSYGKRIFDSLFRYCVTKEWGLVMDQKGKKADPRLHRLRQKEWLKSLCEESNWDALLTKYKLTSGLQLHYQGRLLEAFRANFAWAFDPAVEGHLHDNDFTYKGMYEETATGGRVWSMVDHWVKCDLGVTLYDPKTGTVNRSLLPANRTALAKSLGFKYWIDFERTSGLHGILVYCAVSGVITKTERDSRGKLVHKVVQLGNLGRVLKWYCPKAFDPAVPGHLHLNDFRQTPIPFKDLAEKKEAIMHLATEDKIPVAEISSYLTRRRLEAKGISNLLEEGESALELFIQCFAEEIARGEIVRELLYAPVDVQEEKSTFSTNGRTFTVNGSLRGHVARQEAQEYVVVYSRRRMVLGTSSSFRLTPAYVVFLTEPSTARPFTPAGFPDQDARESLSRQLLKGETGRERVIMQTLPAAVQERAVGIFVRTGDISRVYAYLAERQARRE